MDYLEKYGYKPSAEDVEAAIRSAQALSSSNASEEVFRKCFSLMDLTTLKTDDTAESVSALVRKTNGILKEFPSYPLPASICVYPNFASVVRDGRCSAELHVTTVSACFPSSQSFLEVKLRECELAVENGADEVDIVLALNAFLAGDYAGAFDEISSIRTAIDRKAAEAGRKVTLKVILETGLLSTAENIARASFLAMEAGADFIKTSTGKVSVNATPEAAVVMCRSIAAYLRATGRKVGFKAAGGISNAQDALGYYCIVSSILGEEWLNKDLFRFGVSRLGNSLIEAIEGKAVKYF